MWFSGICAVGAVLAIAAVAAGMEPRTAGGMQVTREQWLVFAAPLVGAIGVLTGLTSIGLRSHRPWARWCFMLISPLIVASAVGFTSIGAVPSPLGKVAVIVATAVGLFSAWLLFWQRASLLYFYRIRQAGGGMSFRR